MALRCAWVGWVCWHVWHGGCPMAGWCHHCMSFILRFSTEPWSFDETKASLAFIGSSLTLQSNDGVPVTKFEELCITTLEPEQLLELRLFIAEYGLGYCGVCYYKHSFTALHLFQIFCQFRWISSRANYKCWRRSILKGALWFTSIAERVGPPIITVCMFFNSSAWSEVVLWNTLKYQDFRVCLNVSDNIIILSSPRGKDANTTVF